MLMNNDPSLGLALGLTLVYKIYWASCDFGDVDAFGNIKAERQLFVE